jgi:hypothetical protein
MAVVAFFLGILVGGAIALTPALSVDQNSAWYKTGYHDGYEKGKREAEGEDG